VDDSALESRCLQVWKDEAESLGASFARAMRAVDPKRILDVTCRYLRPGALCRVFEKANVLARTDPANATAVTSSLTDTA